MQKNSKKNNQYTQVQVVFSSFFFQVASQSVWAASQSTRAEDYAGQTFAA